MGFEGSEGYAGVGWVKRAEDGLAEESMRLMVALRVGV
jgi:hypothetical protein